MDESSSSAAEADEDKQDRSHKQSKARIVGVHPLYLLLPRQIPSLLPNNQNNVIPVTGEPEETIYTSRFVTPFIRQSREYSAGLVPPMVLDPLVGVLDKRTNQ